MSTTVKAGWLKDNQGNKFAPKTMSSQVVRDDGTLLEDKINIDIAELKEYTNTELAKKSDSDHSHDNVYYTENEIDGFLSGKQDKNLIVQYQTGSLSEATLGVEEISTAADAGIDVKFFDGYEYLNLLEYSKGQGFAVFYTEYLDMNEVFTVKYVVVGSDGFIMMSDKKEYNLAYKSDLNAKQDKLTGTVGQFVQFDSSGKPIGVNLDVYTKGEMDDVLSSKADISDLENIDLSAYETKLEAQEKLDEAKQYADNAASTVKNDLLNGAGDAYDTLKELGDLITENVDAIEALETIATNKADKEHVHDEYETKIDAQLKYDTITDAKADWSQNNTSAIDYIKNRTHWVEKATDVLLEEQSVTGEEQAWMDGYWYYIEGLDTVAYAGEQYVITIDGVSYNCESYANMYGENAIGDSRLSNYIDEEGTLNTEHPEDVPFHIQTYYYSEESWELINDWCEWEISFATAGTHTVKIERINPYQSTYHTLDENFIPDTISRTDHTHNYYGVCSTDADVSRKTVNIDGFKLVEGAMVIIKFTNANSAYHPTLNVSGTGDYPMYLYGTTEFGMLLEYDRDRNWVAGAVQVFVYDGNGWIRDYWNYKEYTNGYFGHAYVTCSTDASTIAKTATSPYEYRRSISRTCYICMSKISIRSPRR